MSKIFSDQYWMQHALALAEKARQQGEIPVGAVVVDAHNEIIGEGWNQSIIGNDPTAHAEIIAMRKAAIQRNNYRLIDTTLYVTLEPCIMCAGAIIHSRIKRVVFAAYDHKTGAAGSFIDILSLRGNNHHALVTGGVCQTEASALLSQFFKQRREAIKQSKNTLASASMI